MVEAAGIEPDSYVIAFKHIVSNIENIVAPIFAPRTVVQFLTFELDF